MLSIYKEPVLSIQKDERTALLTPALKKAAQMFRYTPSAASDTGGRRLAAISKSSSMAEGPNF